MTMIRIEIMKMQYSQYSAAAEFSNCSSDPRSPRVHICARLFTVEAVILILHKLYRHAHSSRHQILCQQRQLEQPSC